MVRCLVLLILSFLAPPTAYPNLTFSQGVYSYESVRDGASSLGAYPRQADFSENENQKLDGATALHLSRIT